MYAGGGGPVTIASQGFRVGVIGLGKVAQLHHLPALEQVDDLRVAAVCDLSSELSQATAARYGLPPDRAFTDSRDLLTAGLDAIVIASNHHGPVLRDALTAGLPTLVEKPCTWGLGEAAEVTAISVTAGVPVLVGYMKQYDPAVEYFRASRAAAEAFYVRAHNFAGGRHRHERIYQVRKPGQDISPRRLADERETVDDIIAADLGCRHPERVAAFRTLAQLAIHDINLVTTLFGRPADGRLESHPTPLGTCYQLTLAFGAAQCRMEVLADFGTSRDWDEVIQCYDPAGVAELVFPSPFIRNAPTLVHRRVAVGVEARDEQIMISRESAYLRQLRHFRDVLRGDAQPRTTLPAAVADLELLYGLVRRMAVS
jgi:predicted dehydrogenase